jgi:uncharacterized protein
LPIFDVHNYLGGSLVPGVANNGASITSAMQARGIDAAVIMSSHALCVDPLAGNRILKATLDQGANLYGCLVTHVNRVEASITIMRELMNNRRFLGMAVMGMHPDEPIHQIVAEEILNAYRRYGKPLFIFARNQAMVEAGLDIAKSFPALKVVLVGMGGADWRAAIAAAHVATNIYIETSGPLDRAKLPAALDVIGPHRILFGSGSPRVDAAAAIGLVEDSDISDEARRKIFSDNARRLFGLDQE